MQLTNKKAHKTLFTKFEIRPTIYHCNNRRNFIENQIYLFLSEGVYRGYKKITKYVSLLNAQHYCPV